MTKEPNPEVNLHLLRPLSAHQENGLSQGEDGLVARRRTATSDGVLDEQAHLEEEHDLEEETHQPMQYYGFYRVNADGEREELPFDEEQSLREQRAF